MPIIGIISSQITIQQTANPTAGTPFKTTTWRITITNNDASAADMYADIGTNPPTTLRTSALASGGSFTYNTGTAIGGFDVYFYAVASGKSASDVMSVYVPA